MFGSVTPELSAAILGSFHVVMAVEKMPASVSPLSWSLSTPFRLYDTVIGAAAVGKYRTVPPWNVGLSASAMVLSVPAHCTTLFCQVRACRRFEPLFVYVTATLGAVVLNWVMPFWLNASWKVDPEPSSFPDSDL